MIDSDEINNAVGNDGIKCLFGLLAFVIKLRH